MWSRVHGKPKWGVYKGMILPTALHSVEVWVLENKEKNRVNVAEMSCLRNMCIVEWQREWGIKKSGEGAGFKEAWWEQQFLWWFGHIEGMERGSLVKKIYRADVEGNRERGKPRRRWMDKVKGCLIDRRLTIPEVKECIKDRREETYCGHDVDDPKWSS